MGNHPRHGFRVSAQFIPRDEVEWRRVRMLERPDETFEYEFWLPRPLADWDVFACWERERFHSMRDNLTHGDILFDVGTEQGWTNLIYASFVGPENMVLIEPTASFWPNIQATWSKNYPLIWPAAFYDGLIGDKTTDTRTDFQNWPTSVDGPLIDRNRYQYIHDNTDNVPQMRLDDLVKRSGVVPDALTLDVEGAELLVLKGAADTLRTHRPKVWASLHHDLIERDYGATVQQVHDYMASHGYTGTHLATDHEAHWFYTP